VAYDHVWIVIRVDQFTGRTPVRYLDPAEQLRSLAGPLGQQLARAVLVARHDLRAGTLTPSDPAKLHTRTTSCTPDFGADRTMWLKFLHTTFGGDQQLVDYLQRLVGYSAVGVVGAHVLPYCHGSGGNGKGVFLETCVKVLGGYATTAPAGFLMAKAHAAHETEVARLAGARMVLCSEVNDDDRFDEARVKLLTGGDTLTARFMQQDHFTFTPTHQLWAMGNHQPHVRAGGRSFWRRLRLIPFAHEVPAEEVIDGLQDILAGPHGPAVLAWIVEGAVAYHRDGLQEPEAVKAATGEYAHDQDTVARFLDEMCHLGGGDHVTIKMAAVRTAYENWCHEDGDEPVSAKAFGMALRRRGVGVTRTRTAKMYVGLTLISDSEESVTGDEGWYR
jgi:putative DNA primase/helicase